MKKLILGLLVLLFILSPNFANGNREGHRTSRLEFYNQQTPYAMAIPYDGAFGVNLGDPNDHFLNWENGKAKGYTDIPNQNQTSADGYTDAEMVGLLGIYDAKTHGLGNSENKIDDITISVSSTQGFEFVSQSNPSYRRPFELVILPKGDHHVVTSDASWAWTHWEYSSWWDSLYGQYSGEGSLLSGDYPETDENWLLETENNETFKQAIDDNVDNGLYGLWQWYDVVLNLPGELNTDTDVLTYNNSIYPLIEADDYSALVTLTISWGDYSDSVTIPFTGYYDKDDTNSKSGGTCSMFVTPYAAAAHLSVDKDRGVWVPVGWVEFLMNLNQEDNEGHPIVVSERPLIFASSSSNPFDPDPDRFRLWHEDVLYGATPTSTNGIYFDVQITDGSLQTVSFDGTMNGETAEAEYDRASSSSSNVIIPRETESQQGHLDKKQKFYSFSGEIDVRMETGGYMPDGIYSGTVYIHMVTVQ